MSKKKKLYFWVTTNKKKTFFDIDCLMRVSQPVLGFIGCDTATSMPCIFLLTEPVFNSKVVQATKTNLLMAMLANLHGFK
ncbi:MAG: hypothetical protein ACLFUC_06810 [Bacteroidales bacterium]